MKVVVEELDALVGQGEAIIPSTWELILEVSLRVKGLDLKTLITIFCEYICKINNLLTVTHCVPSLHK